MAYELEGFDATLRSSGDMSGAKQYTLVVASTANADGGCVIVAARGAKATGVYQDNSTTATDGRVRVLGVSKVVAGDSSAMDTAITAGIFLAASSKGHAVPSTDSRDAKVGIALGSLSTGSTGIIAMLVLPAATSTA